MKDAFDIAWRLFWLVAGVAFSVKLFRRFIFERRLSDLCWLIGAFLNQFVMLCNDYKMPVAVSKDWPCKDIVGQFHSCMTETSRVQWLCDIIPLGLVMASIGDLFVVGSFFIASSVVLSNTRYPTPAGLIEPSTERETGTQPSYNSQWRDDTFGRPW